MVNFFEPSQSFTGCGMLLSKFIRFNDTVETRYNDMAKIMRY